MAKRSTGTGLVFIVELGAEWPAFLEEAVTASARRVLSQNEGETPQAFAERVSAALPALFGKGVAATTLALACNERTDSTALEARRNIARTFLGDVARHKTGRVYLTASPRSGGKLRHALTALSHDLGHEWRSAGLDISVNFGEISRSSPVASGIVSVTNVA